MPIYEYQCTKCGHQTEVWQKFSDPPVSECELCHNKMKKLISQSAFHLKGTGWYVTDYASKSGGNKGQTAKSDDKKSGTESKESKSKEASSTKEASSKGYGASPGKKVN